MDVAQHPTICKKMALSSENCRSMSN